MCSCSPTKFTFVLSLDQTCDNNDIEENTGGIIGSFCFTETDVALPEYVTDEDEEEDTTDSTETESIRRKYRTRTLQTTSTNTTDPVTEIVSVQFLEFDTSGDLTVINQDDTYADVSLSNTDTLTFYSASSFLDPDLTLEEQMSSPALVPGGASLILWGKTESGEIVRNRFFWMYDTENCGTDDIPIKMDDEIGWVSVVSTFTLSILLVVILAFQFRWKFGLGVVVHFEACWNALLFAKRGKDKERDVSFQLRLHSAVGVLFADLPSFAMHF